MYYNWRVVNINRESVTFIICSARYSAIQSPIPDAFKKTCLENLIPKNFLLLYNNCQPCPKVTEGFALNKLPSIVTTLPHIRDTA